MSTTFTSEQIQIGKEMEVNGSKWVIIDKKTLLEVVKVNTIPLQKDNLIIDDKLAYDEGKESEKFYTGKQITVDGELLKITCHKTAFIAKRLNCESEDYETYLVDHTEGVNYYIPNGTFKFMTIPSKDSKENIESR